MLRIGLLALAVSLVSVPAFSAEVVSTALVGELTVVSDHFSLSLVGVSNLCSSAPNPTHAAMLIGQFGITADAMKAGHAMALAAKLAGKPLTVYGNDNTVGSQYCIIRAVQLQ